MLRITMYCTDRDMTKTPQLSRLSIVCKDVAQHSKWTYPQYLMIYAS